MDCTHTKTIWKYSVPFIQTCSIEIPCIYEILSVAEQGETGQLWTLVDPNAPRLELLITLLETGDLFDISEVGDYAGTFLLKDRSSAIHVFEKPQVKELH